jgi:hypothetical protein
MADTISTKAYCSMTSVDTAEEVTQISKSTFAVFASTKTQIRVACHDKEQDFKHFTGTITVKLASGCAAETRDHYLSHLISVSTDKNDSDLTRKYAPDALLEFQQLTLRTLENVKISKLSLKHHLDSESPHLTRLANAVALHHSINTDNPIVIFAIILMCIIGIGIVTYVAVKLYKRRSRMIAAQAASFIGAAQTYAGQRLPAPPSINGTVVRYSEQPTRGATAQIEMNTLPTNMSMDNGDRSVGQVNVTNSLIPNQIAHVNLNSTIRNDSGFMPMPTAPHGETSVPNVLNLNVQGNNTANPMTRNDVYPDLQKQMLMNNRSI